MSVPILNSKLSPFCTGVVLTAVTLMSVNPLGLGIVKISPTAKLAVLVSKVVRVAEAPPIGPDSNVSLTLSSSLSLDEPYLNSFLTLVRSLPLESKYDGSNDIAYSIEPSGFPAVLDTAFVKPAPLI